MIGIDRTGTDVAVVGDLAVPAERRRAVDEATDSGGGTLAAS